MLQCLLCVSFFGTYWQWNDNFSKARQSKNYKEIPSKERIIQKKEKPTEEIELPYRRKE
jgi:hypothetical protein